MRESAAVKNNALITPAFLADPYPTYAALRHASPIHWSEEFFGGAWLLTRHADVDAVLRDDAHFSAQRTGGWVMHCAADKTNARTELKGFQSLFARAMLFVDAPDHTRLRSAMSAGFRADALERLRPQVEHWIDTRLATLESSFDFMAQIARPLPAYVIALLLGIGVEAQEPFMAWSDELAVFIGAPQPTLEEARSAQRSVLAMARYFDELIERKRREPDESLVSRLAQAQTHGDIESGAELLAQCAMLLFAGHETTRNFLGNSLHALLSHPHAWPQLQAQPELLPNALRELLRYDSPVQYTGRRVKTDLVLHGQSLKRGDLVIALIGAANRDEQRYAAPDTLDLARRTGPLLSFGAGAHVCIGAALTLMEGQALFSKLLRRWPQLKLAHGPAQWNGNAVYRGLEELKIICA